MHRIRNSILCFAMVSVISVQYAQSQYLDSQLPDATTPQPETITDSAPPATVNAPEPFAPIRQAPDDNRQITTAAETYTSPPSAPSPQVRQESYSGSESTLRAGIGVQCGIRFHQPEAFNDFVSEVWNSLLYKNVYLPVDKKQIGPGVFLSLNGTIDVGALFQVTPFAQGMWAGKQFYFRGGMVSDLHINTYTAMGGFNLWIRFLDRERFTLRAGAGGYGAYTIARVTGDVEETQLSGSGYGVRGLLGSELRLSDAIVLTLDCAVPWGVSKFVHQKGELESTGAPVTYPEQFDHLGFELCPGIMFYF